MAGGYPFPVWVTAMTAFISNIIVAVDGSPQALKGAERGAELAQLLRAEVQLLYVMPAGAAELSDLPGNRSRETDAALAGQREGAERVLREGRQALRRVDRDGVGAVVLGDVAHRGDPARVIVAHANSVPDAMVVMGARGTGGAGVFLRGSVSDAVVHHAGCPVVVVPDNDHPTNRGGIRNIMLPVDGSAGSDAAAELAGIMARAANARVHLLFAHPRNPADLADASGVLGEPATYTERTVEALAEAGRRAAREVFERARNRLGEIPAGVEERHLPSGDAAQTVIDEVAGGREPSVVVMGRRGMGRIRERLLGSVSRSVIGGAACPVVVVH